jgi:Rod binding domain-containing protein
MAAPIPALALGLNVAGNLINQIGKGINSANKDASSQASKLDPMLEAKLAKLDPAVQQKLKAKAHEFETVFLENMLAHITESAGEEGPLGDNGTGGNYYKSMLVNEYAKTMSQSGGVGLSNNILRELVKLQEAKG